MSGRAARDKRLNGMVSQAAFNVVFSRLLWNGDADGAARCLRSA